MKGLSNKSKCEQKINLIKCRKLFFAEPKQNVMSKKSKIERQKQLQITKEREEVIQ